MSTTPPAALPDLCAFLDRVNRLTASPSSELYGFFDGHEPLIVSRAPGRLDVMGGIADYSGSLVLEMPTAVATYAAMQRQVERTIEIISSSKSGNGARHFAMPIAAFEDGAAQDYESARRFFSRDPDSHWAAYAAGAALVLMRERGARLSHGVKVLITSDVPEGKGVSSSAALEVAVMHAMNHLLRIEMEPMQLAVLCQKVENLIVGAPCGIMDQITVTCGRAGCLLALLCQPAEIQQDIEIPAEIGLWGIDSGTRHAVSGTDYTSVRVGAFMGYRIIADRVGLNARYEAGDSHVHIDDPMWRGYLANVTPSRLEQSFASELPKMMAGRQFLEQYQGTTDPVTAVEPDRIYAVHRPTAHPIYEHLRVRSFASLLRQPINESTLRLLGELMYQSHASYSACGLGSDGTDRLIELVREAGLSSGLYGAKITGGGCGGTVVVLGRSDAGAAARQIAERYAAETGRRPIIFSGSSPSAAAVGTFPLHSQNGAWSLL